MSRFVERIARHAARAQDRQLAQPMPSAARARARVEPWALIAAAALAACASLALMWPRSVPALTFTRDGEASSERFFTAPADRPLTLSFSEGSRIVLAAHGVLRVGELDARGARLSLEAGQVELEITHRADTRWSVDAGPFLARVVGTRFSLSWAPDAQRFALAMREGVVELTGPVVGAARRVTAGEVVSVSVREHEAQLAAQRAPSVSPLPRVPEAAPEAEPPSPRTHTPRVRVEPLGYDALARAGRYEEAVRAALAAGWDDVLARAPADVLMRLADAARLANMEPLARAAYVKVRTRFSDSPEAARAAFALGRALDAASRDEAAQWFEAYLREAPRGALRQEALGRLLEARHARGDAAERSVAGRYLAEFPAGPYHALAARVLAGTR